MQPINRTILRSYFLSFYFAPTLLCNVPLNNSLAAVETADPQAGEIWRRYCRAWTRWNHLRTAASTPACGLYVAATAAGQG